MLFLGAHRVLAHLRRRIRHAIQQPLGLLEHANLVLVATHLVLCLVALEILLRVAQVGDHGRILGDLGVDLLRRHQDLAAHDLLDVVDLCEKSRQRLGHPRHGRQEDIPRRLAERLCRHVPARKGSGGRISRLCRLPRCVRVGLQHRIDQRLHALLVVERVGRRADTLRVILVCLVGVDNDADVIEDLRRHTPEAVDQVTERLRRRLAKLRPLGNGNLQEVGHLLHVVCHAQRHGRVGRQHQVGIRDHPRRRITQRRQHRGTRRAGFSRQALKRRLECLHPGRRARCLHGLLAEPQRRHADRHLRRGCAQHRHGALEAGHVGRQRGKAAALCAGIRQPAHGLAELALERFELSAGLITQRQRDQRLCVSHSRFPADCAAESFATPPNSASTCP